MATLINGSAPRGVRNNNPGNLRRSKDPWQGLAKAQTDEAFFVFETACYGNRVNGHMHLRY